MGSLQAILQSEKYIDNLLLEFCANNGHELDMKHIKAGTLAENRINQTVMNSTDSNKNTWTDNVQDMNFM